MDENKKDKRGKIGTIIFITWFVASLLAIMETGRTGNILCVALFGQYFFVFGLIAMVTAIKAKQSFWMQSIFVLVGAGIVAGVLIYKFGTDALKQKLFDMIPLAGISIFVIFGIVLLIMAYREKFIIAPRYSYPVSAKCIKILTRHVYRDDHGTDEVYCPVFYYNYNGKEYESSNNTFGDTKFIEGNYYDINIDPENPEKFYIPEVLKKSFIMELILGLVLTAAGVFVMFMYFFAQ